MTKRNQRW